MVGCFVLGELKDLMNRVTEAKKATRSLVAANSKLNMVLGEKGLTDQVMNVL